MSTRPSDASDPNPAARREADELRAFDQAATDAAAADGPLAGQAYARTLDRLMDEIDALPAGPRQRLQSAADEARRRHERLVETVGKLQETLDFLRLGVKYLVFDVEATKRENAYLRKMLDEANGDD